MEALDDVMQPRDRVDDGYRKWRYRGVIRRWCIDNEHENTIAAVRKTVLDSVRFESRSQSNSMDALCQRRRRQHHERELCR